jgi:hypothetical protein
MKNIILAAICLLALSCSSAEKLNYFDGEIKVYDSFLIEDEMSVADTLPMPESVIGIGGIQVIDSMLLIHKAGPTTHLSILNLNNGQMAEDIAYSGRGPDEYTLFLTFGQYRRDSDKISLYTFDSNLSIMRLNVTDSWIKNRTVIDEKKRVIESRNIRSFDFCQAMYCLNNGSVFAKYKTSYDDPRDHIFFPAEYVLIDTLGEKEIIPFFGKDLPPNPPIDHLMDLLYNGVTRIKPDGTQAVEGMRYMDYINFIDLKNKRAFGLRHQDAMAYEDIANMPQEEYFQRRRHAYGDVLAANDYVFGLYQGNNNNDPEDRFANMRLRIFHWDGTPLASLKPDRLLLCIAFDEKTNRLFACNLEDQIFIYDLNETFEKIRRAR